MVLRLWLLVEGLMLVQMLVLVMGPFEALALSRVRWARMLSSLRTQSVGYCSERLCRHREET